MPSASLKSSTDIDPALPGDVPDAGLPAPDEVVDEDDARERVEAPAADRVAAVRRGDHPSQGVLAGHPGVEPVDGVRRHHDVADLAVGEVEHVVQEILLRERDDARALRLVDDGAQLLGGADALARHDVPDPERPQQQGGGRLQEGDDRPQEHGHELDRPRHERREPLGAVERERLRHELPEHDGEVGDQREGNDEAHPAGHLAGQEGLDGRLAERADEDADGGDADLHGRDDPHRVVHEPQGGARAGRGLRVQAAAAGGDDGVLADHEERVQPDEAEHGEGAEDVRHVRIGWVMPKSEFEPVAVVVEGVVQVQGPMTPDPADGPGDPPSRIIWMIQQDGRTMQGLSPVLDAGAATWAGSGPAHPGWTDGEALAAALLVTPAEPEARTFAWTQRIELRIQQASGA